MSTRSNGRFAQAQVESTSSLLLETMYCLVYSVHIYVLKVGVSDMVKAEASREHHVPRSRVFVTNRAQC